ncbi:MAG: PIG-L family deacetylase [Oscillospiraceae bacterium]|nr:PIG-L family deacetylase [Oscillospiraceae bacterium]
MVKEKIGKSLLALLASVLLAGVFAVMGDILIAWQGIDVKCSLFLLAAAALTGLFYIPLRKKPARGFRMFGVLLATLLVVGVVLFFCWFHFQKNAVFAGVDQGKTQIYADRKVMLIVPHQDDELNVLGGVLEEYTRYGSEVYLVFVTNGDYYGIEDIRAEETLAVAAKMGIPEDHVIYLGYGDDWAAGGPHLYNAPEGQVMTSFIGRTETYHTSAKDVWNPGNAYTVENYLADIESVILHYKPEIIFCSDYDFHIDHKALTLGFEKVMGRILQNNPAYRPLVFKGYAYSTAWYAEPDFFEVNLASTDNVFGEGYNQKPAVYRWEERLRLPVGDYTLSRSLFSAAAFQTISLHNSQEAYMYATRIINTDKVVWYRDTNSLCYDAEITVSSGNGNLLNDFMLLENGNLVDSGHMPYDGVWIPDGAEKTVQVTFPEARDVAQIRLYDNPSPEDNVLAGMITFPDGTFVEFGPLDQDGAAVTIQVDRENIDGFTVVLTQTEGQKAGLTEIEAFAQKPDHGMQLIKLTDDRDSFIYDYWIPEGSKAELGIYTVGITGAQWEQLELSWDNPKCWAEIEEGKLQVIVPKGKRMTLTIRLKDTELSDTVSIYNPGKPERIQYAISSFLEEQIFQRYCVGDHHKLATYKLLVTVWNLIR